uniref:Uncharacterized protein n=1 Tax=Acinetobacter baumannii TaxID=470 RepID=A0A482F377_ACIBA|nr:hypothetical protein [Acinetobacter baumannii]
MLKCMRVLSEILNVRQHFNPMMFVRGFLFKLGYFIYWLNLIVYMGQYPKQGK